MKKCIVIGAGGHCRSLLSILLEQKHGEYDVQGILDTQPIKGEEIILGVKVIGSINDLARLRNDGVTVIFLAIGDSLLRASLYEKTKELGFELPNLIAHSAYIASSVFMGDANLLCHRTHLGPMSRIGNANILNTASILEHESVVGDFCHLAPSSVISGRSRLGSFVFLGVSAAVIDKTSVCSNVTIGAGAVVVKDIIKEDATYVGVPARNIRC